MRNADFGNLTSVEDSRDDSRSIYFSRGMLRKQLTLVLCWNSGSERSVFVIWRAKTGL